MAVVSQDFSVRTWFWILPFCCRLQFSVDTQHKETYPVCRARGSEDLRGSIYIYLQHMCTLHPDRVATTFRLPSLDGRTSHKVFLGWERKVQNATKANTLHTAIKDIQDQLRMLKLLRISQWLWGQRRALQVIVSETHGHSIRTRTQQLVARRQLWASGGSWRWFLLAFGEKPAAGWKLRLRKSAAERKPAPDWNGGRGHLIQVEDEWASLRQGRVHLVLWNDASAAFGQLHTNTRVRRGRVCARAPGRVDHLTKSRSLVLTVKPVSKPISKIDMVASLSLFL